MTQYSSGLIQKTISLFEPRAGEEFTEESARRALNNVCGFFKILNEWSKAEEKTISENERKIPAGTSGF
jgi:hypothetical protein